MKLFRNIPLFIAALTFALSGLLHPLFHGHGEPRVQDETAISIHSDCPVCHGIFQAAELPETLSLPAELPKLSFVIPLPAQPDFRAIVPHGARAPPLS